jgi:hypothetical protein
MFEHINSSLPHVILFFILKLSKSTPLSTQSCALYSPSLYSVARSLLHCYTDLLLPPPPPPLYCARTQKLSHPGSRKQNQILHACAQDVQITCTVNNMVNRYNISLNYKLESLQNDPWVQKKY